MSIGTFHLDEANSDDERLFIDVAGGGTVVITRSDDGISVEIYSLAVSDGPVGETWATWSELSEDFNRAEEE